MNKILLKVWAVWSLWGAGPLFLYENGLKKNKYNVPIERTLNTVRFYLNGVIWFGILGPITIPLYCLFKIQDTKCVDYRLKSYRR